MLLAFEELIDAVALAASHAAEVTGGDGDAVEDAVEEAAGLAGIREQRVLRQFELRFPDAAWHLEGRWPEGES
jgi:hypothetical protein